MTMRLSIIVAIGKRGQIGKENRLLWHIPEDLKNFKNLTLNHHIIMGRKTFESIGKPLPNRISVVVSRSNFKQDGVIVCKNIEEAIEFCKNSGDEEAFIIGGGEIYKQTIDLVDRIYLTKVYYNEDADIFFPHLRTPDWFILEEINHKEIIQEDGKKIPAWQFCILERLRIK